MSKFLEVENLNVSFPTEDGLVQATNEVSYSVGLGETLAIVGESGSGKSVSNLAVMGLHNAGSTNISGHAWLNLPSGRVDLISAKPEELRAHQPRHGIAQRQHRQRRRHHAAQHRFRARHAVDRPRQLREQQRRQAQPIRDAIRLLQKSRRPKFRRLQTRPDGDQ